ncbi:MAG: substrate-binding domain-containing protein [Sphaerochaetaceae bacterium]|nr:substrate-binding domain-containing protein [Sphaerochaetaceae bacterium]
MKKKVLAILLLLAISTSMMFAAGATEEVEMEEDDGTLKVAILLKTLADPFWVSMADGIKAEAEAQGIYCDVFAVQSEADIAGQLKKLEDIVNSGEYDGIGVAPITATNCISGVVAANKAGIPVVNIDAKFDEVALREAGGYIIGFATSDNERVGAMAGEYLLENMPEGGKVAVIEGRAGDLSSELRVGGFKGAIEGSNFVVTDSQPADWDRQKALNVATNIIAKTPDVKAFYVANNTMALGVLQAIKNTGKINDILCIGTDASDETYMAIKAGEMVAVAQSPAGIGATCFNILVDAIKAGEKGSLDYEPVVKLVSADLVTSESL